MNYSLHDALWKGATTTILGIGAVLYGIVGRVVVAATPSTAIYGDAHGVGPVTMADVSTLLGFLTTIAGGIWTWFLLQKAKAADIRREEARKDADVARDGHIEDRVADIQLMVAEGLAKIQLEHARVKAIVEERTGELTSHLERQDVAIQAIAVGGTPAAAIATMGEQANLAIDQAGT